MKEGINFANQIWILRSTSSFQRPPFEHSPSSYGFKSFPLCLYPLCRYCRGLVWNSSGGIGDTLAGLSGQYWSWRPCQNWRLQACQYTSPLWEVLMTSSGGCLARCVGSVLACGHIDPLSKSVVHSCEYACALFYKYTHHIIMIRDFFPHLNPLDR